MLLRNNATPWQTAALVLLVACIAWPVIESSLQMSALKLLGHLPDVLRAEAIFSCLRIVVVVLMLTCNASVWSVLIATALAQWTQLAYVRQKTGFLVQDVGPIERHWPASIKDRVTHVMPSAIWHCLQGQITTVALALVAGVSSVAEIGALARFGILFNLLVLPLGHVILPAISRADKKQDLGRRILFATSGYLVVFWSVVVIGYFLAPYALQILGSGYQHLEIEFTYYLIALALSFSAHLLWGIALAKGWVRFGWLEIPFTVALQLVSLLYLDLSDLRQAIVFGGIGSLVHLFSGATLVVFGLANWQRIEDCVT